LNVRDIISKKQHGETLGAGEIDAIIQGFSTGRISDRDMTKFLKAVCDNGMDSTETAYMTQSMVMSGEPIDLSEVNPPKVDKHSTGGVGDKTTLVVGPLVAAAGLNMAKMSGRSLGHTGGTINKLEAIPGVTTRLSKKQLIEQVNTMGLAIASQSEDLVPADHKIYALRDKTGTVACTSLIAASVMSKKLAVGADTIVLDVKFGSGAFMKEFNDAKELAELCVKIGTAAERKVVALISNMDQPLGRAVGNVLEVKEAIETLKGRGPRDVTELSLELASELMIQTGTAINKEDARGSLFAEIDSGQALDKFGELIQSQGGDPEVINDLSLLPSAPIVDGFTAATAGYISAMDVEGIGRISKKVFGLMFLKKIGDEVQVGDVIADVHANTIDQAEAAIRELKDMVVIAKRAIVEPLICSVIR
jgi:pyrimidine-nucleoside phosphorylase